jgi:hypothetical protein
VSHVFQSARLSACGSSVRGVGCSALALRRIFLFDSHRSIANLLGTESMAFALNFAATMSVRDGLDGTHCF